jgi:hypothetical protein
LFGDAVVRRLGLWHFVNRIYCTLGKNHPNFGKAITMLQAVIYRIDEFNKAAVMQALLKGTLNGTNMSWDDITTLRGRTAQWNKNYASQSLKKSCILSP